MMASRQVSLLRPDREVPVPVVISFGLGKLTPGVVELALGVAERIQGPFELGLGSCHFPVRDPQVPVGVYD